MRYRFGAALLAVAVMGSACQQGGSVSLESNDAKASYAIGQDVGRNLAPTATRLDRAAFLKGMEDALDEMESALPPEELQAAVQQFSQEIMAEQEAERTAEMESNQAAGEAYLAENGAKEGVSTTESGLQYEVLRQGDGPVPGQDDQVRLHYRGTLVDGTEFDSSYDGDPVVFQAGGLIEGFSEALMMMPVGSHYRIAMPADLAYGPNGSGQLIGPGAALIFEIEVLEIVE